MRLSAYDNMGRITAINNGAHITYEYDTYGQIVRENNQSLDKTYVYEYNNNGNIVCVKTYAYTLGELGTVQSQKSYSYDSTHPDRLANYDNVSIGYNAIGCPTTYDGYTAMWTRGKLAKLNKRLLGAGTYTYNFSYDAFGRRISKKYSYAAASGIGATTVLKGDPIGSTKVYHYDESGRLIFEYISNQYYQESDGRENLVYLYDADMIIGVMHTSESNVTNTYYFERNLLGDVIAIYDTSGNRVGAYTYDAWGNCKITQNLQRIVTVNPIRYRGYYYDQDTKLYYLNARYYCPEWRRFISPDDTSYLDPETPNGLNLYTYCNNDPVNYCDPSGHYWEWNTFFTGLFMVGTAITAIALSVATFGAGIPLAMSIVAGVTLGAGVLTGINGIASMIEAGTDYNFVRDGLFNNVLNLSDSAYNSYARVTEGVALFGSMILGFYHTTGQYKTAKTSQRYLGKGYTKAGKNRWVSKDGYRQVRWDTTRHMYKGKPSPVHFNWYEYKFPIEKGIRNELISDIHIWLKWFSYYM